MHAGSPPATATMVTTVEGITEYRLGNGLRFLLFPDQSQQKVTVNITYLVGSRHEGYGESGMAHLLEHLLFKGTPKKSGSRRRIRQQELAEYRRQEAEARNQVLDNIRQSLNSFVEQNAQQYEPSREGARSEGFCYNLDTDKRCCNSEGVCSPRVR